MKYIANGATQTEAALACGCSDGLISQYMAEKEFQEQLLELVTSKMEAAREVDENYLETEKVLSKRLRDAAAMMFNPDQILKVLRFTNEAKTKIPFQAGLNGNGNGVGAAGITMKPVVLILPEVARREFILNPNNEVVGVGDEVLTTMSSTQLNKLLQEKKLEKDAAENVEFKEHSKPKVIKNETRSNAQDYYSDL